MGAVPGQQTVNHGEGLAFARFLEQTVGAQGLLRVRQCIRLPVRAQGPQMVLSVHELGALARGASPPSRAIKTLL